MAAVGGDDAFRVDAVMPEVTSETFGALQGRDPLAIVAQRAFPAERILRDDLFEQAGMAPTWAAARLEAIAACGVEVADGMAGALIVGSAFTNS